MDEREEADLRARLAATSTADLLDTLVRHRRQEELLPEAYAAVQSILRERGVAIEEAVSAKLRDLPDPTGPGDLVVVAAVFNHTEAQLIRMRLEQAGLEVQLADENVARLHFGLGIAAGGVKVLVRTADAELARTLLAEPAIEPALQCPSCASQDVVRETRLLRGVTVAVALLLATPVPQLSVAGRCRTCGHTWEE